MPVRAQRRAQGACRDFRAHRVSFAAVIVGTAVLTLAPFGATAAPAARLYRPALTARVADQLALQQINAVRLHFGLAPALATNAYQSLVVDAARNEYDPQPATEAGIVEEYGVWGIALDTDPTISADLSVVVDDWVYHDGWDGSYTENLDCTSPTAPGCNGHRRAVLSSPPLHDSRLYVDVAVARRSWRGSAAISIAALIVWQVSNPVPLSRD
jgi:hypothetical protein